MTQNLQFRHLESGATLIVDHRPAAASIATGIWVKAGSRQESDAKAGLAHALEHMAFKGSDTRSGEDIARAIDQVGGELDAYTSREITAFQAQVLPEDLGLAVDLVADLALYPSLDGQDWHLEQGVICQEILQAIDTPDDILFDYFQETVFPGQSLGRSILGSEQTVQGLEIQDFKTFRDRNYHAGSLIFAAAGPIELDDFEAVLQPHLSALPKARPPLDLDTSKFQPKLFLQARSMEQVQLLLGWPAVPQGHGLNHAYVLLSHMLGYGGASHLFMEIRERRGLAYMVYASCQFFGDAGHIFIHASTGADQVPELIGALDELRANLPALLTEADLKRAKAQYKAGTLMARDSVASCVRSAAHQMAIRPEPLRLEQLLAEADAVTLDQIHDLARGLALEPAVCALGPKTSCNWLGKHFNA